jgi:hypothetical protein
MGSDRQFEVVLRPGRFALAFRSDCTLRLYLGGVDDSVGTLRAGFALLISSLPGLTRQPIAM